MKFFYLILLLLWLTACNSSQLPESRPEPFSLHFTSDGGMLPLSEQLQLSERESYYDYFYSGVHVRIHFDMDVATLDGLYQTVRDNRFDQIESREELVYDRGGESVAIQFDSEFYQVSNAGVRFVKSAWTAEWGNVLAAIYQLYDLDPAGNPFTLSWDNGLAPWQVELDLGSNFAGALPASTMNELQFSLYQPIPIELTAQNPALSQAVNHFTVDPAGMSGLHLSLDPAGQLSFQPITK